MFADLVLFNGKIVTMDAKESIAEAVAVKSGRLIAVGLNVTVEPLIGENTLVINLNGKTVIPGLIDSHCHMASTGARMINAIDLSEEAGIKSIADLQKKIAEETRSVSEDTWIIGVKEDDSKLVENRHPTRRELDEAAPNHPVIVSTVGGHFYIVNSTALERGRISPTTADPVGGVFERDSVTGELTGGVHEKAIEVVVPGGIYAIEPSRELTAKGAKQMFLDNVAAGLTCVYDMVDQSQIRAILDLKNRNELPLRVRMDVRIELFEEMNKLGIYRGLGDAWVRICGLKTFFDGAVSARTAAVAEPYLHRSNYYGVMATTKELARNSILEAYAAGYRISAHANGERAISMYLDIMQEAQTRYPRDDPRNRVIHCSVVNADLITRIACLNMLPSIFGSYPYYHGDKLLPAFGADRLERMFAARSFLDAGVRIAAHSDHSASPYPPLMGIHALVNRITVSGKPIGQTQRISVMEALQLYTINAAYHSFDEDWLGSLETGKFADMVVLGQDILSVPPESIIDIPVELTIINGKIVYRRTPQVEL
jgi:predicted amidohydrolase YtcJ